MPSQTVYIGTYTEKLPFQDSDTVATFGINRATGDLEPTGQVADIPNPVCILPVQP